MNVGGKRLLVCFLCDGERNDKKYLLVWLEMCRIKFCICWLVLEIIRW